MNIIKRIASIICLIAFVICVSGTVKVKADTIQGGYDILKQVDGLDLTSITYAFEQLNQEQKSICFYLLGCWNNIYLTSRGFSYSIPHDETHIKAQFLSLGQRVLEFCFSSDGWRSRLNEEFRQYLSSIIVYSSEINTSFESWFNSVKYGSESTLLIPFSADAFSAWTTFYNDPSGDGIISFGEIVADWNSGSYLDFAFGNVPFVNNAQFTTFTNFISDPTVFTPVLGTYYQFAIHPFINNEMIDTLIIARNTSNYAFGTDYNLICSNSPYDNTLFSAALCLELFSAGSNVNAHIRNSSNVYLRGIQTTASNNVADIIQEAFYKTPFRLDAWGSTVTDVQWYPAINHVYLVDDLVNFGNPVELHNTVDLDINLSPDPQYIIAPNQRMLLPVWPTADDDPMDLWDNIVDNALTEDLEPVTDDDFQKTIVNNTVINNYYVSDGDKINVPVNWFDNSFTIALFQTGESVFEFAKDCIDCLGEVSDYLYGAIVIGLAGGIVNKLLL